MLMTINHQDFVQPLNRRVSKTFHLTLSYIILKQIISEKNVL